MAYEKTIWKNNEAPKINATNLNKIEEGIANAVEKGVTLFDDATGGNVVLSDTPSNYNTLDIYYNVGSTVLVQTVKANSAYFVLTLSEMDAKVSGNTGIINHYKNYIVNDKTFVVNAAGRLFKYQRDTNVTQDTIDYIWIMKVIGYK